MPKKFMGFDVGYLKREYGEGSHAKMSAKDKAHEKRETPAHEKREHKAANAMMAALKRKK